MVFWEAVSSSLRKYAQFSGRAGRVEYLCWVVLFVFGSAVVGLLDSLTVLALYCLAILLPGLAVTARQLHDIDKSAWWLLALLFPVVGSVLLTAWCVMEGTRGPNQYGEDPMSLSA